MITIFTGKFTILILQKYNFKVCVISFSFYSTHFKVYIRLPYINTQLITTEPFNNTLVISSSDRQTTGPYQGPAYCCEGDHKSGIILLLHQYQKINYCSESVLAIVLDLNILVFSIRIFELIPRSTLVRFSLLRAIYLYNSSGLRLYIFCL